jgi:hypothetical protein
MQAYRDSRAIAVFMLYLWHQKGVGSHRHTLVPSPSERGPSTHCKGGWSGWVWKISPLSGFEPQTIQPVACCCTSYAIPAILFMGEWDLCLSGFQSFLDISNVTTEQRTVASTHPKPYPRSTVKYMHMVHDTWMTSPP